MSGTDHTAVAETIIKQLAGSWGKLRAMTGARHPVSGHGPHGGVSFKFGRGQHCMISLRADDTYDVEFCRIVKHEKRSVKTISGVYCDNLSSVFESETGLYLAIV